MQVVKMFRLKKLFGLMGIARAVDEVVLLANLTVELVTEMGSRLLWIYMTLRFFIYVVLLTPAFWRCLFVFIIGEYIEKSVPYGKNPRNYLDIYHPTVKSNQNRRKGEQPNRTETVRARTNNKVHTKSNEGKHHHHHHHTHHHNDGKISVNTCSTKNKYPVVIFVTGGAWMIGHKAWGAFMGMLLAHLGIIFISPDYRNFPQGTISSMIEDIDQAVQWVIDHIESYGGDISRIFLCGQSAGGHICNMLLLQRAKQEYYKQYENSEKKRHWTPTDLAGYISIGSPSNLVDLKDHIDQRGLYMDVLHHIMENDIKKFSPSHVLCQFKSFNSNGGGGIRRRYSSKDLGDMDLCDTLSESCSDSNRNLSEMDISSPRSIKELESSSVSEEDNENIQSMSPTATEYTPLEPDDGLIPLELCPVFLFHGQKDQSVPSSASTTFARQLKKLGVETYIKIYHNKTHTGPIIEDPIEGNDPLICDILRVIFPNSDMENVVKEVEENIKGRLIIPHCIVSLARHVCPF